MPNKHQDKLAARPGYQVIYSVGWVLGEREKAALRRCGSSRAGSDRIPARSWPYSLWVTNRPGHPARQPGGFVIPGSKIRVQNAARRSASASH